MIRGKSLARHLRKCPAVSCCSVHQAVVVGCDITRIRVSGSVMRKSSSEALKDSGELLLFTSLGTALKSIDPILPNERAWSIYRDVKAIIRPLNELKKSCNHSTMQEAFSMLRGSRLVTALVKKRPPVQEGSCFTAKLYINK